MVLLFSLAIFEEEVTPLQRNQTLREDLPLESIVVGLLKTLSEKR